MKTLLLYLHTEFRKKRLTLDPGLVNAAKRLALHLKRTGSRNLYQSQAQAALWLAGGTDRQLFVFAMSFRQLSVLRKSFRAELLQRIFGKRPTHAGLSIVGSNPGVFVALFSQKGAFLGPFPRIGSPGRKLTLRFRLLPGVTRPKVVLGMRDGTVLYLPVKKNASTFTVTWTPLKTGPVRWQVIAQRRRGPQVFSEWTLHVIPPGLSEKQQLRVLRTHYQSRVSTATLRKKARSWTKKAAVREMWRLVQELRKHRRLLPFVPDARLSSMAAAHARDMVRDHFFGHRSPQQGDFSERFSKIRWNVQRARENIVVGSTPSIALRYLMQSPVHRRNLISRKVTHLGIGAWKDHKGDLYFVQVFVKP